MAVGDDPEFIDEAMPFIAPGFKLREPKKKKKKIPKPEKQKKQEVGPRPFV